MFVCVCVCVYLIVRMCVVVWLCSLSGTNVINRQSVLNPSQVLVNIPGDHVSKHKASFSPLIHRTPPQ